MREYTGNRQIVDIGKNLSYVLCYIPQAVGCERRIMGAPEIERVQSGIRQEPLSFWWKIPNRNITVLLDIRAIERITEEIGSAAANGVPKAEIGGLLLGSVTFGPTLQVMATECFPIACKHELGPSHRLSYADKMLFWKQLNRYKEIHRKSPCFVSYYRSNIGHGFELTPSDFAIARDFAPDLFFFLLIQSSSSMNIGGLLFPYEGRVQLESRVLFPFDRDRLLSGETIIENLPESSPSESSDHPSGAVDTDFTLIDMPESESQRPADFDPWTQLSASPALETPEKISRKPWLWIAAAIPVLVLAGLLYLSLKSEGVQAPRPEVQIAEDLGLSASVEQDRLYVKWNRTFPKIQSAKRGVLSIQSDASTQTVTLNLEELLRGNISLPHSGSQVSVKLQLISEESTAIRPGGTEANASTSAYPKSPKETAQTPAMVSGDSGQPQSRNRVAPDLLKPAETQKTSPAKPGSPAGSLPKVTKRDDERATSPAPIRTTDKPRSLNLPASPAAMDAPPKPQPAAVAESPRQDRASSQQEAVQAARQPQTSITSPAPAQDIVSSAKPLDSEPKPAPAVAENADASPPVVSSTKPKEPPESPAAFIPPRSIEAIGPIVVPADLRSQMPQSMEIDVRIYVDAAGAVIGAKSLSDNARISRIAVDAVRRIRFTPARRGKENVASDLIVKLKLVAE